MKGVLKIAAGFVVAGVLLASPQSGAVAANVNPHTPNAEGACGACHTDGGGKDGSLRRDLLTTCGICHAGNLQNHPVYRHPMNVVVRFNTPSPMPLSETKRLVCTTCHDPHASTGYEKLLRVEYQRLCVQCHVGY